MSSTHDVSPSNGPARDAAASPKTTVRFDAPPQRPDAHFPMRLSSDSYSRLNWEAIEIEPPMNPYDVPTETEGSDVDDDYELAQLKTSLMEDLDEKAFQVESQLRLRPSKDDLVNRNILPAQASSNRMHVSMRLYERQRQLKAEQLSNRLEQKLAARPEKQDLEQARIIRRPDTPTATEKAAPVLERKMKQRPAALELKDRNILRPGPVSPRLQEARRSLELEKKQQTLSRRLQLRPERERLQQMNVIHETDGDDGDEDEAPRRDLDLFLSRLRPDRERLQQMNVIHEDAEEEEAAAEAVAPRNLDLFLSQRRSARALVDQGIIPDPTISPLLATQTRQLHRAQMSDMLAERLEKRRTRGSLADLHIIQEEAEDEDVEEKLNETSD